jgi:hypothetical protein
MVQPRAPRHDVDPFICNGWELLQVQELWKQMILVDVLRELYTRRAINGILTLVGVALASRYSCDAQSRK